MLLDQQRSILPSITVLQPIRTFNLHKREASCMQIILILNSVQHSVHGNFSKLI